MSSEVHELMTRGVRPAAGHTRRRSSALRRVGLLAVFASLCAFGPPELVACSSGTAAVPVPTEPQRPLGDSVPITENVTLPCVSGPVDVARDSFGMVHIYATRVTDAMCVMGYQMGRDRNVQLELLRRAAEGRMAEVLGSVAPSLIDSDINMRTIGLTRVAQRICDGMDASDPVRQAIDAFSAGISAYYARLQSGAESLPKVEVGVYPSLLTPWTCTDTLAIARLQEEELSLSAADDVDRQQLLSKARATFNSRFGNPQLARRAGMERDVLRFAPLDTTPVLPDGFPKPPVAQISPLGKAANVTVAPELLAATQGWRDAQHTLDSIFGDAVTRGSNDWIVGPSLSADGHPLVASDPHLALSSPSVFWMVHLSVHAPPGQDSSQDLEVSGLAFPGTPGIILGENEHVAWGATDAEYDVSDVYAETLTSDGSAVVFNGANVPLQKIHEDIAVANGPTIPYDVLVVPHHGPILPNIVDHAVVPPNPAVGALSVRWTGLDPSNELRAILNLDRAKNVDDVRTAMRDFKVGAENWVSADDQGNIFYTSQSRIPQRAPGALAWDAARYVGTLPLFVLPGGGTAEWTHDLDEAYVPHVKNPAQGFLATANTDPVGVTFDNDPSNDVLPNGERVYIGGAFDPGFRLGRIVHRLKLLGQAATPDDMASIQADVHSPAGAMLAPKLLAAIAKVQRMRETASVGSAPGSVPTDSRYAAANIGQIVDWLRSWAQSDYASESGVNPDNGSLDVNPTQAKASQATLLFDVWLQRMVTLTFADEIVAMGHDFNGYFGDVRALAYIWTAPDPSKLATYDPTTKESSLFDNLTTPAVETSDQLALAALLDAIDYLDAHYGTDRSKWRWGYAHTLTLSSLVPLWGALSIPPSGDPTFPNGFPRHGDLSTVDPGNYSLKPGLAGDLDFSYDSGPTQRFVADMQSPAPVSRNALPGGEIWDNTSPHFRDEMERWRRNLNRPVWILKDDVIQDAKERIAYDPP